MSAREIFFLKGRSLTSFATPKKFSPKFTGMLCTATRNNSYIAVPKNKSSSSPHIEKQ